MAVLTEWETKCPAAQTVAPCHGSPTQVHSQLTLSLSSITQLRFSIPSLSTSACPCGVFAKVTWTPLATKPSPGHVYRPYPLIDSVGAVVRAVLGTTWIPYLHCGTVDSPPTCDMGRLGLTGHYLFMACLGGAGRGTRTSSDTRVSDIFEV